MTRFWFDTSGVRPAVALVASHGLTDFDTPRCALPAYLLASIPAPSLLVTAVFLVASMVHFADDLGATGSVCLHSTVAAVTAVMGVQAGLRAMGCYLLSVHVPSHYARCAARERDTGLAFATIGSAIALAMSPALPGRLALDDRVQRIVVGHVLTEWQIAQDVTR